MYPDGFSRIEPLFAQLYQLFESSKNTVRETLIVAVGSMGKYVVQPSVNQATPLMTLQGDEQRCSWPNTLPPCSTTWQAESRRPRLCMYAGKCDTTYQVAIGLIFSPDIVYLKASPEGTLFPHPPLLRSGRTFHRAALAYST